MRIAKMSPQMDPQTCPKMNAKIFEFIFFLLFLNFKGLKVEYKQQFFGVVESTR